VKKPVSKFAFQVHNLQRYNTGYNEFSLLSLSCSDYLALPALGLEIKNRLKDENVTLSLPSQRIDRFDDSIANILGGAGKTGLTFAPEVGLCMLNQVDT
jgi:radical SAM superfamily enzyme YgiQ (UPF0313 family)